jgi:hypothetical protein
MVRSALVASSCARPALHATSVARERLRRAGGGGLVAWQAKRPACVH